MLVNYRKLLAAVILLMHLWSLGFFPAVMEVRHSVFYGEAWQLLFVACIMYLEVCEGEVRLAWELKSTGLHGCREEVIKTDA
jgi:hypothetical protein